MKRTWLVVALLVALALTPAMAQGGVTLQDMAGREVALEAPATKVIALNPADCEILYALGAQDVLVGRGEYCNYPAEVTELPSVGSGEQTNIEEILALEPTVMIMSKMAQTEEQVAALESAGVKVIISDAQDIEGVYTAITMLGTLTGKATEAEALIAEMKSGFDALKSEATDEGKSVYFEISPLEWGLWTAGNGTFMNELAQICGLENVFADVSGWAEVSQEQVIERNPDYIVTTTMYMGEGATPEEEILGRSGWEGISAIQNGTVVAVDSDTFSRPGPRLLEAAEMLMDLAQEAAAQEPAA